MTDDHLTDEQRREVDNARSLIRELAPRAIARAGKAATQIAAAFTWTETHVSPGWSLERHRAELVTLMNLLDEGGAPHVAMRVDAMIVSLDQCIAGRAHVARLELEQLTAAVNNRDELARDLESARRELVAGAERIRELEQQLEALR